MKLAFRARLGTAEIDRGLTDVFRITNRYLRDMGVDYWLAYGTMLGHHRHGSLLPRDRDVDFGLHEQCFDRVWKGRDALPKGATMGDRTYAHRGPKLWVRYADWKADLYFFEDLGDALRTYENSRRENEVTPIPKGLILPTRKGTLAGEPTRLPKDPKGYLEHVYGYLGADALRHPLTGYWHKVRLGPVGKLIAKYRGAS
jgi:hypothetical protein